MTALIGYATLALLIILLLRGKMSPIVVFGIVPLVGAICMMASPSEINEWIGAGLNSVWKIAVLFIFSVEYFSIMQDTGMFDVIVNKLAKMAGSNVVLVAVATACVAIIGHLDGSTAVTALITIPAMLPLWKRLHMRPTGLLFILGTAMGVMNLIPWGGPIVRVATVLNMDVTELWHMLIPFQGVCLIVTLLIAVVIGLIEKKHGAGLTEADLQEEEAEKSIENEELRRPKLLVFNMILTAAMIVCLVTSLMATHICFMIALAIALAVNYPDAKLQRKLFSKHASAALDTSATLLEAAVFIGVMQNSGMLDAMVEVLIGLMPPVLGQYINLLAGFLSVPIGCCLGADTFYYGVFPLIGETAQAYGIPALDVGVAMLIGKNVAMICSPLQPTTYLALGLAGVEMKDHLKSNFPRTWLLSIGFCAIAILMGLMKIY